MENTEKAISNDSEMQRKEVLANRTKMGFHIILLGALTLLISGLIALFTPLSDSVFEIVLYGFTSLGSAMIIFGLYKAIG